MKSFSKRRPVCMGIILGLLGAFCCVAADSANMVNNPVFAEWRENGPAPWFARGRTLQQLSREQKALHPEGLTALRVDIVRDGGSSYGEIVQSIPVDPGSAYRFSGDVRSSRPGVAFFQIKRVKGKEELERIALPWSSTAWQHMVCEVETGDADTLLVTCRYRQKKEFVGNLAWYTNVRLTALGAGRAATGAPAATALSGPIDVPPPPSPEPASHLVVSAPGHDQYVLPEGAGSTSGADWANARAAANDGLTAAWNAAGPGRTVYLGSGTYQDILLVITNGGSGPQTMKTLRGVDTGGGRPVLRGSLDFDRIAEGWQTMIAIQRNVGHVAIAGVDIRDCSRALMLYGNNRGIRLSDIHVARARESFTMYGAAADGDPALATRDVVVSDCTFHIYTKCAIRLRDGISGVRILRCRADAGGKAWYREPFPMGFQIGADQTTLECRDITYVDCVSRNNYHEPDGDKSYWNGDGFTAEREVADVTYVRCLAADNTDAGWDLKARNPVLVDCVALRNKRNFRIWSRPGPAVLVNCLGAYSVVHKTGEPGTGLWLAGDAHAVADRLTLFRDAIAVDADGGGDTVLELRNSLLATREKGAPFRIGSAKVVLTDTAAGVIGAENDPGVQGPGADWDGERASFRSGRFPDRGYRGP